MGLKKQFDVTPIYFQNTVLAILATDTTCKSEFSGGRTKKTNIFNRDQPTKYLNFPHLVTYTTHPQ